MKGSGKRLRKWNFKCNLSKVKLYYLRKDVVEDGTENILPAKADSCLKVVSGNSRYEK
jgi:hypothetical protein